RAGHCIVARGFDRTPCGSSYRRNEILLASIAEFYFPRDCRFIFFPAHANAVAERCEVGIAAAVDRMLWTGLYAGVALPTHIGFDVEGAPVSGVDMHDVGRADIDTMPTAVATRHVNEGRHGVSLSPVCGPTRGLNSAGHA